MSHDDRPTTRRSPGRGRGVALIAVLIGIVMVAAISLTMIAALSPSFRESLRSTAECMTSLGQRCGHGGDDSRVPGAGAAPSTETRASSTSSLSADDVVRFIKGEVPLEQQVAAVDDLARRATDFLTRDLDSLGLHPQDREFVGGFVDGAIGIAAFVAKLAVDPVGTIVNVVRPWVTEPLATAQALWTEVRERPYHALGGFVAGFGAGKLLALPIPARRLPSGALAIADHSCVGAACTGRTCFAAGTLVDTASGPRAIETIIPGSLVLSRDPASGLDAYKPVLQTFQTRERPVEMLQLADGAGVVETLTVTPEHPFFVDGRGWVPAADLDPAHDVVSGPGRSSLSVRGALMLAATTTVYNLEVDEFHTYFVGRAHAWVHNQCRPTPSWDEIVADAQEHFGRGNAGVLEKSSMQHFASAVNRTTPYRERGTPQSYRWVQRSDGSVGYMSDDFMRGFYDRERLNLIHRNIGQGPKGWFAVDPSGVIFSINHLPGSPHVLPGVLDRLGLAWTAESGRMMRLAEAVRTGKNVELVATELGEPLTAAERLKIERAAVDVLRHGFNVTGQADTALAHAVAARQDWLGQHGVPSSGRAFNILAFGPHESVVDIPVAQSRALRYFKGGDQACVGAACIGASTCFAAGTLVDTAAGLRPIETIAPGELVLSRDPQTGVEAYEPVVRTFETHDRVVEQLQLADTTGAVETVTVTPEHPFFANGRGWVSAAELDPARDSIRSAGGARLSVVAALMLAATSTVYNLEVDHFHTYFVGHAHAWVHNQCTPNAARSPLEGAAVLPTAAPPPVRILREPGARTPAPDEVLGKDWMGAPIRMTPEMSTQGASKNAQTLATDKFEISRNLPQYFLELRTTFNSFDAPNAGLPNFEQALRSLGPQDTWLNAGTGMAYAEQNYYDMMARAGRPPANVTTLAVNRPRRRDPPEPMPKPVWMSPEEYEKYAADERNRIMNEHPDRWQWQSYDEMERKHGPEGFRGLYGRYLEDIPPAELQTHGKVLVSDLYGPYTYGARPDAIVDRYLALGPEVEMYIAALPNQAMVVRADGSVVDFLDYLKETLPKRNPGVQVDIVNKNFPTPGVVIVIRKSAAPHERRP
jgi:hypothetical protein